jgi:endonuclease G, mitochondrial
MSQPIKSPERLLACVLSISLLFTACKKNIDPVNIDSPSGSTPITELTTLTENFESGAKTAYAAGNVTLSSGSWNFNDALTGNLSTDRKNGSQSARIRNTGSITMNFNFADGASAVTVQHAVFGTDGSSTWELRHQPTAAAAIQRSAAPLLPLLPPCKPPLLP